MGDLTGGAIKKVCVEPYYLAAARRSRITLPAVMAVFLHCRHHRWPVAGGGGDHVLYNSKNVPAAIKTLIRKNY